MRLLGAMPRPLSESQNLQEWIDYVEPGAQLYIPPGRYRAPSGGFQVSKPLDMFGAGTGGETTLVPYATAASEPCIYISCHPATTAFNGFIPSVSLSRFMIDGGSVGPDNASAALAGAEGIHVHSAPTIGVCNVNLSRLYVKRMGADGLAANGLALNFGRSNIGNMAIRDCVFSENWGNGALSIGGPNVISENNLFASNYGMGFYSDSGVVVSNNDQFRDNLHNASLGAVTNGQMVMGGDVSFSIHGALFIDFTKNTGSVNLRQANGVGLRISSSSGLVAGSWFYNSPQSTHASQFGIYVDNVGSGDAVQIGPNRWTNLAVAVKGAGNDANLSVSPQRFIAGTNAMQVRSGSVPAWSAY